MVARGSMGIWNRCSSRTWGRHWNGTWSIQQVRESLNDEHISEELYTTGLITDLEPDIVPFFVGCGKLHLSLRSRDYDGILVYARWQRVRIQHRADGIDVR
jgi:hypothetical protein